MAEAEPLTPIPDSGASSSAPTASSTSLSFRPAGRFRRLMALAIDTVLLGLLGATVTLVARRTLIEWGPYGRVFGFIMMPLYLGVCGSHLGGGQTIGKWITGLRLVGTDGAHLSLVRSLLRALLITAPYLLNNWHVKIMPAWMTSVQSLIVFGFGGSMLYYVLANRRTGQGPHDLFTHSVVIRTDRGIEGMPAVWRGHLWVLLSIVLALGGIGYGVSLWVRSTFGASLDEIQPVWKELQRRPDVFSASVNHNVHHRGGASPWQTLTVQVWVRGNTPDEAAVAADVAAQTLQLYPKARQFDMLAVAITRAVDVGVFSWRTSNLHRRPPAEWDGSPSDPQVLEKGTF